MQTESKREDIFDRMMGLPGLRIFKPLYQKHKEVLLYLFFGGLAVFLNLALFVFFTKHFGWGELFANIIDWVICVLFQFIKNKTWVFDAETDSAKGFWAQLAGFFSGSITCPKLFSTRHTNSLCETSAYSSPSEWTIGP